MTDHDDGPLHELAPLDPVLTDAPPGPGSSRFDEILERAMDATDTPEVPDLDTAGGAKPVAVPDRVGRRVWPSRTIAAVAAAVLLVVGLVVIDPFGTTSRASAAEVVTAAAQTTGSELSFRGTLQVDDGGERRSSRLEVDGDRIRVSAYDGLGSDTLIGDMRWSTEGGEVTSEPVSPDERPAPFASSSEAVVLAALSGARVEDLGEAQVRDEATTHYRISLDDTAKNALAALDAGQLAWFELEYPKQASTVDVWVADDLIRRIRVVSDFGGSPDEPEITTTELYDFGADITIDPPT